MLWGVKNVHVFKLKVTVSFRFILYLVHELMGMMSHHTAFLFPAK